MFRIKLLPVALALTAIASGASLLAQSADDTSKDRVKLVPQSKDPLAAVPFDVNSGATPRPLRIEIRSADQMTQQDRDLEAKAESSIRERARFQEFDLNEGNWTHEQLVCPTLPNHLLLRFFRNNGARDVSMFSASIPRSGGGRVRLIPILRRSYSLFSPAPINAITIAAFNRIRAEENPAHPPEWSMTGLCYAALAGSNPEVASPFDDKSSQPAVAPTLEVQSNGGAVIRFVLNDARPMEWAMTFDAKGRLLKASHSSAGVLSVKTVRPETSEKVRPVPQTFVVVKPTDVH